MTDPAAPKPFDLDTAGSAMNEAVFAMVRLSLTAPGQQPDPEVGRQFMEATRKAVTVGSAAIGEVSRMRTELTALRDSHRPQPHADPTKPGALCAACSIHGSLVAWPCGTWTAAERILTHGRA